MMKYLKYLLVLLLLASPVQAGMVIDAAGTEFGEVTVAGATCDWTNTAPWYYVYKLSAYSQPGAGRLCNLSAYAKGTTGNISMVVYKLSTLTAVCLTTAQKAVGTNYAWISWDYTELKPYGGSAGQACTLEAGEDYLLGIAMDDTAVNICYQGTVGDTGGWNNTADYTDGSWPESRPTILDSIAHVLLKGVVVK